MANESITIDILDPELAQKYLSDIMRVYQESWLATYPNEAVGITHEDVLTRFQNADALREEWSRLLNSKDRQTWIARSGVNDEVVGFCTARKDADTNELEYLYLLSSEQGKGAGAMLITQALEWLGNDHSIVLFGAAYNTKAIRFYEKFGFRLCDEPVEPKILPNGKKLPSMKMIKDGKPV